jgi:hypothetical protein
MCPPVMLSALTSKSMGFSFNGTGTRSLPEQRLLPPGARPGEPFAADQRLVHAADLV